MTTLIEADILTSHAVFKGVPTQSSLIGIIDHSLDITFNCNGFDANGDPYKGVFFAYATISGEIPFVDFETTLTATASISGTAIWGSTNEAALTSYASFSGDLLLENLKNNWVKWSNIGDLDFTVGKDNVAGERPMDWKGWLYAVKKLGGKSVAYGSNGVSLLIPHGVYYELKTIYRLGLKSKQAIAGDDKIHFFIDVEDQLFSLGEEFKKLDYSEYLSVLTDPVMSYDIENGLVYICDGTYGFVYSPSDESLGTGPINITGISSQGGTLYVASPAAITTPAFEICTDIYDLKSRNTKTVVSIEYGTNVTTALYASIDHRMDIDDSFTQTPWYQVSGRGTVWITTFGREFRLRLKTLEYEYFELDYIRVNGVKHAN